MTVFLSCDQVVELHDMLVKQFGGLPGIRAQSLLESAVASPMMAAFGEEFYQSLYDKAAAYLFFITCNHPFVDGNKRTASATSLAFLRANGENPEYVLDDFLEFIVKISRGEKDLHAISQYLKKICSHAD